MYWFVNKKTRYPLGLRTKIVINDGDKDTHFKELSVC